MISSQRLHTLISLLITTPLGFASKFYHGAGAWWFNNYASGIFYEMFWCFAAILLLPRVSVFWIACTVLGTTCVLEFLQLWHPLFLDPVRSTFIGRTLIGTTFTWWDFPHYVIGCLTGWLMISFPARGKVNG